MTVVLVPRLPQFGKTVKVHARWAGAPIPAPNDVHIDVHTQGGAWQEVVGYDHGIPAELGDPVHGVDLTLTPGPPRFPQPGPYLVRVRWTRDGTTVHTEPFTLSLRVATTAPQTVADLLTIEVIDAPRGGNCGFARSTVRWHVAFGLNGWVIQHVRFVKSPLQCVGGGVVPSNTPLFYEYWEAWQVRNGHVFIGNLGRPVTTFADTFQLRDWGAGTYGSQMIQGRVAFMQDFDLAIPPWLMGVIPAAGVLPTVQVAPAGWDDASALEHRLEAVWDCCINAQPTTIDGAPLGGFQTPEQVAQPKRRNRIAALLESVPPWSELPEADRRGRASVATTMAQINRSKTATIREGVKSYIEANWHPIRGASVDALSRVFVLNRYVFAVPEMIHAADAKLFGGWDVPVAEQGIEMIWPWSQKRGRLVLTGVFSAYLGAPYLALEEFDYFAERFGRRVLS